MLYVMVNPSTADGNEDDATIRKCVGFAKRHGFGAIIVVNLFAFRTKDVDDLGKVRDSGCITAYPYGDHVEMAMNDADLIVLAWGARAKMPKGLADDAINSAIRLAEESCVQTVHIGPLTKTGDPRHPLMLGYDQPLTDWLFFTATDESEG